MFKAKASKDDSGGIVLGYNDSTDHSDMSIDCEVWDILAIFVLSTSYCSC